MKKHIEDTLLNIIGSILLAFGVSAFIVPFDIICGGATGLSIIGYKLTGINMSFIVLAINILCLPIGYFLVGKELVFGSLLSSFVYPIALYFFNELTLLQSLADNLLLASICAGVSCGIGIGLVMRSGGSTGGVDIPILCIHKYTSIPVNTLINICDWSIMVGQIPFSNITHIIYGFLYTYIMTSVINKVLTWGPTKYKVKVISEQYEEIRNALIHQDFGVTMYYSESGYTHTNIKVIESICTRKRIRFIQELINSIDSKAFITIETVSDVKGRGFTLEKEWLTENDTN